MTMTVSTPFASGSDSPGVPAAQQADPVEAGQVVPKLDVAKLMVTDQILALAEAAAQVAALCWRLHKGRTQVLMVTSRDTGRWVLPKGWPIKGLTPEAAAAREAWEEAGVEGKVSGLSIGHYGYEKLRPGSAALPCRVDVFPLRVQSLKSAFPERKERRRKWFGAVEAAVLVAEADLRALLARLDADPALLAPVARARRHTAS